MPGKLTTHILDTAHGRPAVGVKVELHRLEDNREKTFVASGVTNLDGRLDQPLMTGESMKAGRYRMLFHVGDYFVVRGNADAKRFLDVVPILFNIDDAGANYHVPLLVTPWSYSTYRGS